jgi:peptide/nickel transport system substrate-binding protein
MRHLERQLLLALGTVLAIGLALPGPVRAETPPNMLVLGQRIDDIITLDPAEVFEFSAAEIMNNVYDRITTYKPGD